MFRCLLDLRCLVSNTIETTLFLRACPHGCLVQDSLLHVVLFVALISHVVSLACKSLEQALFWCVDPPWTPFWLRTQDVLLPVEYEGGEEPKKDS